MTRLLTCGWETGDLAEDRGVVVGQGTHSVVTSTPTPRAPGTYCFKLACYSGGTTGGRQWNLGTPKTDLWIRFNYFLHPSAVAEYYLAVLGDSANSTQGYVTCNTLDGTLKVYRGSTVLGTSVPQMSFDQWHLVELRWQITSTTVGIVEVWIDGTRWLNLTAIDNTQTANANVQYVQLGGNNAIATTAYLGFDDFAINDTAGTINNGQIGDGRVVLLKPNGAGSNTGQTRGGTDSGANWSQVDEVPPSLTDYVYSSTVAARDTYALEDVPAGTWAINCVEALAYAQNNDSGTGSLGLTLKSGATTNEATAQNLTTSGTYYRQLYETDPDTSGAWTVAAVNALEAGTTVR